MAQNSSADGHRKRLREKYIKNKSALADYEALELLLTYSVPRRDVKPLAKELINTFGSLNAVLNAEPEALLAISGVGENSAVLINLVRDINIRAEKERNKNKTRFVTTGDVKVYFKNILGLEKNEKIVLVTLDNGNKIINTHVLSEGSAGNAGVDPKTVMRSVINDNAVSAVVAHNHPSGSPRPSDEDVNFTLSLKGLLNSVGVSLLDHVIVGENGEFSMAQSVEYEKYF